MAPPAFDPLGLTVVIVGTLATLFAFACALRVTFRPGETARDHPKRSIFKEGR